LHHNIIVWPWRNGCHRNNASDRDGGVGKADVHLCMIPRNYGLMRTLFGLL
jgi:hypothetical protein